MISLLERTRLKHISYTVVDEADEMLHDDWEEEMAKIMGGGGMSPSSFILNSTAGSY